MSDVNDMRPIIISASIAIDRLMRFAGTYQDLIQPDKLDSLAVFPFIEDLTDAYGGVGGNIAYSLALLGDHPYLLGSAGKDAGLYLEKLKNDGVNTSGVHISDKPTATFTCITDANQSQIGGFYPGAMFDAESLTLEPWKDSKPLVLVGPHDPAAMKRQVEECVRWNLELCYDIGQQVSNLSADDMREGVSAAHILILNDYELGLLSKKLELSADDIKKTVPIVVTTLGKDGSIIEGKDMPEPIRVGIAKPAAEADPTGAGDAFRSGFLYGYVRGWDLKHCAQLGAVTGSFALEHAGTQTHRFTLEDAAKRHQDNFGEPLVSK